MTEIEKLKAEYSRLYTEAEQARERWFAAMVEASPYKPGMVLRAKPASRRFSDDGIKECLIERVTGSDLGYCRVHVRPRRKDGQWHANPRQIFSIDQYEIVPETEVAS